MYWCTLSMTTIQNVKWFYRNNTLVNVDPPVKITVTHIMNDNDAPKLPSMFKLQIGMSRWKCVILRTSIFECKLDMTCHKQPEFPSQPEWVYRMISESAKTFSPHVVAECRNISKLRTTFSLSILLTSSDLLAYLRDLSLEIFFRNKSFRMGSTFSTDIG